MAPESNTRVLPPARLAHVVLRTAAGEQFHKMKQFYVDFLGGKVEMENEVLAFLRYDDEHHRVALVGIPGIGTKDRSKPGLEHIAFTYDSVQDLLTSYKQRKALGFNPIWCVNHGPTLSIYWADPDGNQIETQVDSFDTAEEASAFMQTEDFKVNPFGVDFVPEELEKKLQAGEDVKTLLKRPINGPRAFDTVPLLAH